MISGYAYKKILLMALFLSATILLFLYSGVVDTSSVYTKKADMPPRTCNVVFTDRRHYISKDTNLTMIYFVTPTYPRPEQVPELTRLGHTLMHVPQIHWIVADDNPLCSQQVLNILGRSGLPYTHISSPKPAKYSKGNFPRGVANRRAAISWIRKNIKYGVLYFGDDDNTLDLQLFDEIRTTKRVSMFPVGLIGGYGVSSPVVKNGKVVAFFDAWAGSRTFAVDMAGFAVNIEFLKPTASMPYKVGLEEDKFLISLGLKMEQIEPLASNCSKILVWHTKTKKNKKHDVNIDLKKLKTYNNCDNFVQLLEQTASLNMANITNVGMKAHILRNQKVYSINRLPDFN